MRTALLLSCYCLVALLPLSAQSRGNGAVQCPVVRIEAERLADLNLPRNGHSVLNVNGEPTVIGGHTTNFVPTPTLEYYKNGEWHLVPTAFTHDDGCAAQLSSGQVLIGGGHERNLGIGQSFEAEFYDPLSRTCEGFGSLDTKRALASALALDDNRAVITGNWYHEDAIELYDGKQGFLPLKAPCCGRASPFILRTTKDDAIIFSSMDSKGEHMPHTMIDRLDGDAYREPFLEEWGLLIEYEQTPSSAFIGDEAKGDYSYLLMIENEAGEAAIARVTNGQFSLLSTDVPIPMSCQWGRISYGALIFADRQNRRAYLLGTDQQIHHKPNDTGRVYVITIDYAHVPAHLTFGYTDVISGLDIRKAVMTPDGDLMLVGGLPAENNFKPSKAVWLLHVSPHAQAAGTGFPWWGWVLVVLAIAALATGLAWLYRRRKHKPMIETETLTVTPNEEIQEASDAGMDYDELMHRICQIMEEQQLYLNPNLKVSDIATALGTNRTTISACINSQRNCSFPQFVNAYRVAHAQKLLHNQPDIKIAEVCVKSGFSSEASFYRIFKAITGTTPTTLKSR